MTKIKAELIDHMGTDLTVVNAARVSFAKESAWEEWEVRSVGQMTYTPPLNSRDWDVGVQTIDVPTVRVVKKLSERDAKLIRYLAANGHWTPFAHAQITMRETVPIFLARQRFKHIVGFVYNEESRRYVDDTPEFYTPKSWRKKAENKKQGSSDEAVTALKHEEGQEDLWGPWDMKFDPTTHYLAVVDSCKAFYEHMLASGVCPEQARMVLPQSMMTSYYVTGSLAAWARAFKQRTHEHAQREWEEITNQWNEAIRPLFPSAWGALVDG